jgi:hypothetical protein
VAPAIGERRFRNPIIAELEILDDELPPCAVEVRLRRFDVHSAGKNFLAGLNRELAVVFILFFIRENASPARKRFGGNRNDGGFVCGDLRMGALALPGPCLIAVNNNISHRISHFAWLKLECAGIHLDADNAIGAAGKGEFYKYNAVLGESRSGAGESFEFIYLGCMGVFDLHDWQIAVSERGMLKSARYFAKAQFILANAKNDRRSHIAPTARTATQIDPAAI